MNVNGEVQLTGRNVQEIQLHNAVAITDTSSKDSAIIDVSALAGRKYIHCYNSLNQPVNFTLVAYDKNLVISVALTTIAVPAGTTKALTVADIPQLVEPLQKIKLRAACATAPTSGSVTSFFEGVTI